MKHKAREIRTYYNHLLKMDLQLETEEYHGIKEEDVSQYLKSKWPVEDSKKLFLDDVSERNLMESSVFELKVADHTFHFVGTTRISLCESQI